MVAQTFKQAILGQAKFPSLLGSNGGGIQRTLTSQNSGSVSMGSGSMNPITRMPDNMNGENGNTSSSEFGDFSVEHSSSSSKAASQITKELSHTNEITMATTNQHGVKLVTRPTTSIANRLGYEGKHALSDSSIREKPWDLNAMTARPALVQSIKWDTDTPSVMRFSVPFDLLSSNLMAMPFYSFKYFKGDIVLQFQVNASPLYQGCLMVSYLPLFLAESIPVNEVTYDLRSWMSMNQSMYIYANTNTVAEMRIPYFHWKSYISVMQDVDDFNTMGSLVFLVLNPLQSSSATPVANVSVYMHLENPEFKVPLPNSVIPTRTRTLRHQGNTTSNITQVWDHVQGSAMTTKTEGDKLDMKAQVDIPAEAMAALDNPTFPVMLPNLTVKGVGHASSALGCEYVERLAIYPSALSVATDETFGTSIDEMCIANIKQRYTYITSFDVAATDVPGTVKMSIPMSPVFGTFMKANGDAYPPGTLVQAADNPMYMPLLSYLSLPFTTWNGGLAYKFQFVASAVHTCKIFVGLHYGVMSPEELVSDLDLTGQYGVAYEINQGSNELEVTAPYIAPTPYLYVPRVSKNEQSSMGTLTISIVNALVAPASVSPMISVNVFVAGASDFQVNGLHPALPFIAGYDADRVLRAQSSVAPTNIAPTVTSIAQDDWAGPDQVNDDGKQLHFSRNISSLRDILRKYQFVTKRCVNPQYANGTVSQSAISTQKTYLRIDPWYLLGTSPALNGAEYFSGNYLPDMGALTWFSSMYGLFRGSLRFKVFVRPIMSQFGSQQLAPPPVSWRVLYAPPTITPTDSDSSLYKDYAVLGTQATAVPNAGVDVWRTGSDLWRTHDAVYGQSLVSMVSSPSIVAEFEIPYLSIYHALPIKQRNAVAISTLLGADGGLGSIYVMLDFLSDLNTPNTGNAYPFLAATVEIHVAFGDETRLGNLNYLPMLYTNPITTSTGAYKASPYTMDFGKAPVPPTLLRMPLKPQDQIESGALQESDGSKDSKVVPVDVGKVTTPPSKSVGFYKRFI